MLGGSGGGRGAGNSGGGAEAAGPPVGGRGRGRPQQAAQPSSVEEMEQGLKRLLNIAHSQGGHNPLMDVLEDTPGDDEKNTVRYSLQMFVDPRQFTADLYRMQCFGSVLIWWGSGSRVLMTENWKKLIWKKNLIQNYNPFPMPS